MNRDIIEHRDRRARKVYKVRASGQVNVEIAFPRLPLLLGLLQPEQRRAIIARLTQAEFGSSVSLGMSRSFWQELLRKTLVHDWATE